MSAAWDSSPALSPVPWGEKSREALNCVPGDQQSAPLINSSASATGPSLLIIGAKAREERRTVARLRAWIAVGLTRLASCRHTSQCRGCNRRCPFVHRSPRAAAVKRPSASLSPRDRRESGRAVPRGAHRARSALSASRRESGAAARAARETPGVVGRNGEAPSDRSLGASVYRPSPKVFDEREMAPHGKLVANRSLWLSVGRVLCARAVPRLQMLANPGGWAARTGTLSRIRIVPRWGHSNVTSSWPMKPTTSA